MNNLNDIFFSQSASEGLTYEQILEDVQRYFSLEHAALRGAAIDLLAVGQEPVKAADEVAHLFKGMEGPRHSRKGQVTVIVEPSVRNSIGQVLSSVEIDTSLVASHVTVLKSCPFIGLMGYSAGETPLTMVFSFPSILCGSRLGFGAAIVCLCIRGIGGSFRRFPGSLPVTHIRGCRFFQQFRVIGLQDGLCL